MLSTMVHCIATQYFNRRPVDVREETTHSKANSEVCTNLPYIHASTVYSSSEMVVGDTNCTLFMCMCVNGVGPGPGPSQNQNELDCPK